MQPVAAIVEALLRGYSHIAPTERGGYRLARLARRFRNKANWRDAFTTPDGLRLALNLATYPDCCMAYGLYELDTARLLKKHLRPGDHFIDGGANIGYFTLLAAKCVGPNGHVDAFEPQPDNRDRLLHHLEINQLADRVTVHPLALGDRNDQVTIHRYRDAVHNHGSSTLFAEADAPTESVNVAMVRMDEVLAGASPRVVKLDIEGAEPLAVAGMGALLGGASVPDVILELNAQTASQAGFAADEAVRRLLKMQPHYQLYEIGWRLRRLEGATDLASLGQVNLLCTSRT